MLVNNHRLQLKEAYRVLRKNGKAGFSIWGRRENTAINTLIYDVAKDLGYEKSLPIGKSLSHLRDKDEVVEDIK